MARLTRLLAVVALLAPQVAWAQDATVLAVVLGPPLLAAPFLAQYLRSRWLLPRNGTEASVRALAVTGIVECLLWALVGFLTATVVFDEGRLALALLVAGLAALLFTLRALGAPHRSWIFTLAMVAVFPAVFAVAVVFAWVLVLVLG
jgi:hypothetical protein